MKKEENNNVNENKKENENEAEKAKQEKVENKDNKNSSKNNELEALKAQLKEEKEKSEEYCDHLKRNMAEFDNFKKRMSKEKESMYNTISADIIAEILPILDNFDKALNTETSDESYKNGMAMIYKQLNDTLKKLGVEEIDALNKVFDPNFHEAVMHVEDESFGEKEIVEVFRKGYKIGDKIIRHAMVKVAN